MADLQQSYQATLKIWIGRFREAQRVIRELEDENEHLRTLLARDRPELLRVVETSDGHGGSCGCG